MQRKDYSGNRKIPRQTRFSRMQKLKNAAKITYNGNSEAILPSTSHAVSENQSDKEAPVSEMLSHPTVDYDSDAETISNIPTTSGIEYTSVPSLRRNSSFEVNTRETLDLLIESKGDIDPDFENRIHNSTESDEEDETELPFPDQSLPSTGVGNNSTDICDSLSIVESSGPPKQPNNGNENNSQSKLQCSNENSVAINHEIRVPLFLHILRSKHGLTHDAVCDIINIINDFSLSALGENILPKDPRTLTKKFEKYLTQCDFHFLCKKCGTYFGTCAPGVNMFKCSLCGAHNTCTGQESAPYFAYMPLHCQLKILFEHHLTDKSFLARKGSGQSHLLESMLDGKEYKKIKSQLDPNVENITLSFGCDGFPVFSSSGSSAWPLLCTINELPPNLRKLHVLMPAIWYGISGNKPDMNQYLVPFVKECLSLHYNGFKYNDGGLQKVCKVTVIVGISDSVARPLLLNSHQFNGEYGCSLCLHPGVQIKKGKGTFKSYPHVEGVEERNITDTLLHAEQAAQTTREPFHVFGMKGLTILRLLVFFNIVKSLVPDYMHASILGVVRYTATLWFSSKYSKQDFSLRRKMGEVNKRLLSIKPPLFVSRIPRSMEFRKFFKAHEWYSWLLFFSPSVLKGLLKNKYYSHWMLLVEAIFLLLQESIAKSQVYNAHELLIQFVQGVEELYGRDHVTFNVHLHEHLAQSVLDWGPLWEQSAFLFEDFNQVLLKSIHSSKGVMHQITSYVRTVRSIPILLAVNNTDDKLQRIVSYRQFYNKKGINLVCGDNSVTLLNQFSNVLSDSHRLALVSSGYFPQRYSQGLYCRRIILNGEIIHSRSHHLVKKRNSFTVLMQSGKIFCIETFLHLSGITCLAIGTFLTFDRSYRFSADRNNPPYLLCVKREPQLLQAVNVFDINTKVVFVYSPTLGVNICCIPPNRNEELH